MTKELTQLQPKACMFCGKFFRRRPGERLRDFENRITCSATCRIELVVRDRKKIDDEASEGRCIWCDNVLDGQKKSYCSRECVNNHAHARAEDRRELARPKFPEWPSHVSFADQNIECELLLGRVGPPPITFSITGSSSGYTADRGEKDNEGKWNRRNTGTNHYVRKAKRDNYAL